jgi:3-oxoacyl-[acyl-carrier protein] reductase
VFQLHNKVAAITGCDTGLGQGMALALAQAGCDIVGINVVPADETAALIRDGGRRFYDIHADLRSAVPVQVIEHAWGAFERIDILVNNAGVIRDNQLAALDDDDIRVVLDTNIGGVFNITRAVIPHMIVQRSGKIINLSSVSADKGGRGQTNYAASKGAINAFTRSLAVELAPRKITVNAVAPGVIETEMSQDVRDLAGEQVKSRILLRRYGKPEEVAYAVWFLASRYADYMTGQVVAVDGGFKME